ncbi:hypothetical protein SG09_60360 [Bradyrhizobium ottawaense]|nr:hypothetical protein SG09_60360 [Bradyrhizobium ottawaense]BBO12197.1 hypothetical protein TM102_36670 [Bradyrhizobium sp. TM102]GMO47577.1 hypothetical protein BwSF21_65290 [Bradyrhizobium ottawaense]GMO50809.1 hypothetical protein BwSH14_71990 [Bradyrhizobium ottawaense]GMO80394.1 hypothetical protein BwSG10_52350 [Bradyrhizobium ottawaense]
MRWPVAMPTSRSAAVSRGLAASARDSALRIVKVWACDGAIADPAIRHATAHARRAAILLRNIKPTCEG